MFCLKKFKDKSLHVFYIFMKQRSHFPVRLPRTFTAIVMVLLSYIIITEMLSLSLQQPRITSLFFPLGYNPIIKNECEKDRQDM